MAGLPAPTDFRAKRGATWAVLAGALFGVLVSLATGTWERRAVSDLWQRAAPRTISANNVVVVLIDSLSLDSVAPWPWPRYYLARLTETIAAQRPAAIGFDIIFPEPDPLSPEKFASLYPELDTLAAGQVRALPQMDTVFASVIGAAPVVMARLGVDSNGSDVGNVLADSPIEGRPPPGVLRTGQILTNIPELDDAALTHASLNGPPDTDGIVRRVPLTIVVGGLATPGMAVELARLTSGAPNLRWHGTLLEMGGALLPADDAGRLMIRFGRFPDSQVYSAAEVLAGKVPDGAFASKAVLIGLGAEGTADIVATPLASEEFGVLVQAQAVDAMLSGGWLARPPWLAWTEWLTALVAVLLTLASGVRRQRGYAVLAATIIASAWLISWLTFSRDNLIFDPLRPTVVGLAALLALGMVTAVEQARSRLAIHRAFDKYLSPELVARIVRDPSHLELGGEERDMTVMFCDVRGFSAISEKMAPQEIIRFLIGLLTPMTDILLAGKATIDKYVGDAIIAFWNAPLDDPRHATNAADAALAMIARLRELNVEMPQQDRYPWPGEVRIGIGLNAGPVCVGNMGSERRLNYSMIGDTVNLASRIEGLTKYYGVDIAVGEELAGRLSDYALLELDRVRVVGRDRPERIFAMIGGADVAAEPTFASLRERWDVLLIAYREQRWEEAESLLANLEQMDEYALGKLRGLYTDRIGSLRERGHIAHWDGIFTATEK